MNHDSFTKTESRRLECSHPHGTASVHLPPGGDNQTVRHSDENDRTKKHASSRTFCFLKRVRRSGESNTGQTLRFMENYSDRVGSEATFERQNGKDSLSWRRTVRIFATRVCVSGPLEAGRQRGFRRRNQLENARTGNFANETSNLSVVRCCQRLQELPSIIQSGTQSQFSD